MRRSQILFLCLALLLVLLACNRETVEEGLPPGVLYQDDFTADTGDWILESDADAEAAIVGGQLKLSIHTPSLVAWAELSERKFNDFVLKVDASQLAGPDDNSYGIIFRMKEQTEFYRFDISGDGYYEFSRRNDDDANPWTSLSSDWQESAAIHQGASTNQIKIVAQGSLFTFYINEQQIAEIDDNSYRSGAIGLDAGSFHQAGVEVAFDNLSISEP